MSGKLATGEGGNEEREPGQNGMRPGYTQRASVVKRAGGHFLTLRRRQAKHLSRAGESHTKHNFLSTDVGPLSRCTKESVDRTMASSLAHTWPYNPNTEASLAMLANIPFALKTEKSRVLFYPS